MACGLRFSLLTPLLMLGACTSVPTAPSIMALPGAGKTVAQFRAEDYECRQAASVEVGGKTSSQAGNRGTDGTAVGTPAAAAAGTGPAVAAPAATGAASDSTYDAQWRYDITYMQCMYAKGHKIPVGGVLPSGSPPADYKPLYPPPPPR